MEENERLKQENQSRKKLNIEDMKKIEYLDVENKRLVREVANLQEVIS